MSKVTMQDLAQAVGVSRITVWKALNNRAGVSESLRNTIRQKAAELGYGGMTEGSHKYTPTYSVVVSRPESSAFWMQIIHHIAKELSGNGINLMYTYMPSAYSEGYALPASLSPESVEGFIALNVYDPQLFSLLTRQPVPKVFLDTPPAFHPDDLGGDLVIIEGRTRVHDITARLLESGRSRLGFIGDTHYAQTNLDRFHGFVDAHREGHVPLDERLLRTGAISLRHHYEEISQFLDSLSPLPDAIVCASDFIADFVLRYLQETGRKTPDGFLLTGFDNNTEYANVAGRITTVDVETSALGKRLARLLMFRAAYPDAPAVVGYVSTKILFRPPLD